MFTLRDEVFPGQSGTAQARQSIPEYQQAVGDICRDLNAAEEVRSRDSRRLDKKLERAPTTIAQRNVLLDSARRSLARDSHALRRFEGLAVPLTLAARHRVTATAWKRNVERIRGYAHRLDEAGTRAELLAATEVLGDLRPALASDGDTLDAGLMNLGGGRCQFDPPAAEPTITLPELDHATAARTATREPRRQNPPSARAPTTRGPGAETPTPRSPATSAASPKVSPSPSHQPRSVRRVNTPGTRGGGAITGITGGEHSPSRNVRPTRRPPRRGEHSTADAQG
jgi:hypothetical protein